MGQDCAWIVQLCELLFFCDWLRATCPPPPQVYIIEANPRASRTVPFVAKAIGHPLAAYASLLMSGKKLADIGFTEVGARGRQLCNPGDCVHRL